MEFIDKNNRINTELSALIISGRDFTHLKQYYLSKLL